MRRIEGLRLTRRRVVVGVLLLAACAEVATAYVVLGEQRTQDASAAPAVSLHPVAGSFQPNRIQLGDCSDDRCTEQAFGNVAYRRGPRVAMTLLAEKHGDGSDPACHRIAHIIGAASLARYTGNVARTFAEGSATCFSGYYHGVLERSLVDVASFSPDALGATARGLCAGPSVRALSFVTYQCLHGLGHGLMITTGYDLPLALEVCNRLPVPDREACKGGAFMENISTTYGVTSRWLRDDDPVYPCNRVVATDKLTCYQLVTSRIIRVIGLDWERTAEICATVEARWRTACFQSLGRDIAGQTHRDPGRIRELCAVARPFGGERACLTFAAMDMTANYAGGAKASVLCSTTSAALRAHCYRAIGSILGGMKGALAERKVACRAMTGTPDDVAQCLQGALADGTRRNVAR